MNKSITHFHTLNGFTSRFHRFSYQLLLFSLISCVMFSCNSELDEAVLIESAEVFELGPQEELSEYLERVAPSIKTNDAALSSTELSKLALEMQQTHYSPKEMNSIMVRYFSLNQEDWMRLLNAFQEDLDEEGRAEASSFLAWAEEVHKSGSKPFHLMNLRGEVTPRISTYAGRAEACAAYASPLHFSTAYSLLPRFGNNVQTAARLEDSGCKYMITGYKKDIGRVMPISPQAVAMVAAHSGGRLWGHRYSRRLFVDISLASAFGLTPPTLVSWIPIKKKN